MLKSDELDPQIRPIVDAANAAAAERPPVEEQSVAERRLAYDGLSRLGGSGPDVSAVDDLDLDGVAARRYSVADPVGIFVYYHGGGWTLGDLDTHDPVCRQLAVASNATVISVGYRLGPEHLFPAAVEDSWTALRWAHSHRNDLGVSSRIAIGGDSAGGNLAAVGAVWARDNNVALAGQALVYPVVDTADDSPSMTENGEGYLLTSESMRWFIENYQPDHGDWRASPIKANSLKGVAPALVITAGFDPLRDQGLAYASALRDAGVQVETQHYPSMPHAFFQLAPIVEAGQDAIDRVGAFVKAVCAS